MFPSHEAMQQEHNASMKNKTWEGVPLPLKKNYSGLNGFSESNKMHMVLSIEIRHVARKRV